MSQVCAFDGKPKPDTPLMHHDFERHVDAHARGLGSPPGRWSPT